MSRRTALLLALPCLPLLVFCAWPGGDGVLSQANFDRVSDGMALAEAEAILGRPDWVGPYPCGCSLDPSATRPDLAFWDGGSAYVMMKVIDGNVCDKHYMVKSLPEQARFWWR